MSPITVTNRSGEPSEIAMRLMWDTFLDSLSTPDSLSYSATFVGYRWWFVIARGDAIWWRTTTGTRDPRSMHHALKRVRWYPVSFAYALNAQKTRSSRERARDRIREFVDARLSAPAISVTLNVYGLRGFLANRDATVDATLYMILADWLDEHGYERHAEAIRASRGDPATSLYILRQEIP